jgi:two-component system, OmpR family, response regulator
MRVLLVEDDDILGEAVRDHVAAQGHAVDWATSLSETDDYLATTTYGLILLDLQLPDGRGIRWLKRLRAGGSNVPVIIATARDQISDRIEGLNSGADDYLTKPFDLDELAARLAAVARRYGGLANPALTFGDVEIDRARRTVTVGGRTVDLSPREWIVLEELLVRPGATISKRHLEDAIYAFGMEVESNTIEVYVSRLRKKIGPSLITTVRGLGYRIAQL